MDSYSLSGVFAPPVAKGGNRIMEAMGGLLRSWTGESDPIYRHMNFPPSVNQHQNNVSSSLKSKTGFLTFLSDTGAVVGCILFIVSCLMDLAQPTKCGWVSCRLTSSISCIIGCFFFFITPLSTFILNDAGSLKDFGLTINISMYIASGVCFTAGALFFAPFIVFVNNLGAAFYFVGSLFCLIAVLQDMYRVRSLHARSLISNRKFLIEIGVGGICLLASIAWTVGSLFFFSFCSNLRWGLILFAVGSFFYGATSLSGHLASLWRYTERLEQIKKSKAMIARVKSTLIGVAERTYGTSSNQIRKITRSLSLNNLPSHADRPWGANCSNNDRPTKDMPLPPEMKKVQSTISISAKQIKRVYCAPTYEMEMKYDLSDDSLV